MKTKQHTQFTCTANFMASCVCENWNKKQNKNTTKELAENNTTQTKKLQKKNARRHHYHHRHRQTSYANLFQNHIFCFIGIFALVSISCDSNVNEHAVHDHLRGSILWSLFSLRSLHFRFVAIFRLFFAQPPQQTFIWTCVLFVNFCWMCVYFFSSSTFRMTLSPEIDIRHEDMSCLVLFFVFCYHCHCSAPIYSESKKTIQIVFWTLVMHLSFFLLHFVFSPSCIFDLVFNHSLSCTLT